MNPVDTLAGALELRPGPARPNIRSTRPALVRALVQGKPAAQVPDLLGRVFALCGGAHRLVARRAIAAAQGDDAAPALDDRRQLQFDTLREQLRRIWLDWPAALSGHAPTTQDLATLRRMPAVAPRRVGRRRAARDAQLARHASAGDAGIRLAAGLACRPSRVGCRSGPPVPRPRPARLLNGCRTRATLLGDAPQALRVHAAAAPLRELADRLRADPGFAAAPTAAAGWHETGPWTRAGRRRRRPPRQRLVAPGRAPGRRGGPGAGRRRGCSPWRTLAAAGRADAAGGRGPGLVRDGARPAGAPRAARGAGPCRSSAGLWSGHRGNDPHRRVRHRRADRMEFPRRRPGRAGAAAAATRCRAGAGAAARGGVRPLRRGARRRPCRDPSGAADA